MQCNCFFRGGKRTDGLRKYEHKRIAGRLEDYNDQFFAQKLDHNIQGSSRLWKQVGFFSQFSLSVEINWLSIFFFSKKRGTM
jgi:hypothetical protein